MFLSFFSSFVWELIFLLFFRLPLVQGGTISFLVPTLAILNLPQWKCPAPEVLDAMSHENRTELWQLRMRELSGAIAVSALFQVIVGFGGKLIIVIIFSFFAKLIFESEFYIIGTIVQPEVPYKNSFSYF